MKKNRGFAHSGLVSSSLAYIQSSKDCLSPYMGETHKEMFLFRSYAYFFGTLLTSSKLDKIFEQYNEELIVITFFY
jgi:hypothetical protein